QVSRSVPTSVRRRAGSLRTTDLAPEACYYLLRIIHTDSGGMHALPIPVLHRHLDDLVSAEHPGGNGPGSTEVSRLEGPVERHAPAGCGRPVGQIRSDQALWTRAASPTDAGVSKDP